MLKTFACLAALVTLTTAPVTASAESYDAMLRSPPTDTYLASGVSLGGQRAIQAAVHLEGGTRLGTSEVLYVRGQLTSGTSGSDGSFQQLRAGIEKRQCSYRGHACLVIGADLGYQRDDVYDTPWTLGIHPSSDHDVEIVHAHDALVVPRAALELGRNLKLRGTVEVPMRQRLDVGEMDDDGAARGHGLTVAVGVGYAF